MRIILVQPPIAMSERKQITYANIHQQIPLGPLYILAYLRENGHEVAFLDADTERLTEEETISRIKEFKPDFIGLSVTTLTFHRAVTLGEAVAVEFPGIPLVLGGPHVSAAPEHAMKHECFTVGVIGEGEITTLELVSKMQAGEDWRGIVGITYRGEDGKIVVAPRRELIADLDILPFPAYDLVPDLTVYTSPVAHTRKLKPTLNVLTTRGCPNACTFCDRSVFGQKVRFRRPEKVVEEILLLRRKYGIKEIYFVDDAFTIRFERVRAIFDMLKKEGEWFPWTCQTRVNLVTEEDIKYMKEAGCWLMFLGVESGDAAILKTIKKHIKFEDVRNVAKWCHKAGIATGGLFIIGHPGETLETIDKTIDFALSVPFTTINATLNTPIPGSEQYKSIRDFGTFDDVDWANCNFLQPVFTPHGLTYEILMKKHREFYRRFFFRPKVIYNFFKYFFLRKNGMESFRQLLRSSWRLLFS